MVCSQCGAGLTPDMVKQGACGFCGTAVEGVAQAHMEEHVDERVRKAEKNLQRQLKKERQALKRELQDELDDREPSAVVVAAAEAGRYTAAKVWGCGAGCLSTIGSLILFLVILGFSLVPVLYETWLDHTSRQPHVEQPKPSPKPHPSPKPNPQKKKKKKKR